MAHLRGGLVPGVALGASLGISALIALNVLVGNGSSLAADAGPSVSTQPPVATVEAVVEAVDRETVEPDELASATAAADGPTPTVEPEGDAVLIHVAVVPGLSAD